MPKQEELTADDHGVLANAAGNEAGVVYVSRAGNDFENDALDHLIRLCTLGLFQRNGHADPTPFEITDKGRAALAARFP